MLSVLFKFIFVSRGLFIAWKSNSPVLKAQLFSESPFGNLKWKPEKENLMVRIKKHYVQYYMNGLNNKNGAHITIIEFEGRQTTRVRETIYKEKSNWIVFCANIYLASSHMYDFYSFRSRVVLLLLQKNSPTIRWSKVLQGLSMAAWGICKDSLNFVFPWLLALFYQV